MSDQDQPEQTEMTLADRYEALQERASNINHQLRVMAIPGPPVKPGQVLTVKPIEADAMTLVGALDWAEQYLVSEEAMNRGAMYAEREEALADLRAARARWIEAAAAVAKDIDDSTDTLQVELDPNAAAGIAAGALDLEA